MEKVLPLKFGIRHCGIQGRKHIFDCEEWHLYPDDPMLDYTCKICGLAVTTADLDSPEKEKALKKAIEIQNRWEDTLIPKDYNPF